MSVIVHDLPFLTNGTLQKSKHTMFAQLHCLHSNDKKVHLATVLHNNYVREEQILNKKFHNLIIWAALNCCAAFPAWDKPRARASHISPEFSNSLHNLPWGF